MFSINFVKTFQFTTKARVFQRNQRPNPQKLIHLAWNRGYINACIIIDQMITTRLSHCAWFESCATAQFHGILVAGSYSK